MIVLGNKNNRTNYKNQNYLFDLLKTKKCIVLWLINLI